MPVPSGPELGSSGPGPGPGLGRHGAKVGVLSLQGAWRLHAEVLEALGATVVAVDDAGGLAGIEALVVPGGESTAISHLLNSAGLVEPLAEWLQGPRAAVMGTCAGMILLATDVLDGREDQVRFSVVDIAVRRNGYGPQRASFETGLDVEGCDGGRVPATFIRAPLVTRTGPEVEVLARLDGDPVLCRQGRHLVSSFHPELSGDLRVHQLFLAGL